MGSATTAILEVWKSSEDQDTLCGRLSRWDSDASNGPTSTASRRRNGSLSSLLNSVVIMELCISSISEFVKCWFSDLTCDFQAPEWPRIDLRTRSAQGGKNKCGIPGGSGDTIPGMKVYILSSGSFQYVQSACNGLGQCELNTSGFCNRRGPCTSLGALLPRRNREI